MPTPPDRCTFLPICAQDPTVAQPSTMDPSSTKAPTFTKDGINTTLRPIKADRRTIDPGTARKPAVRHWLSPQPSNLEGTLSHHVATPLPPAITPMSFSRKDSSTAFLAHWFTCQSAPRFSATRSAPLSNASSVASMASRVSPFVAGEMASRASQAELIAVSRAA